MDRRLPKIKEPIMLNIGCGEHELSINGYTGIDMRDCGQKIVWDVRDCIPFPDNSVEKIYTSHFVEHLDEDEVSDFFHEVYRILKKGSLMENRLPHITHATAFYTGHKSFWNEMRVGALIRMPGLEKFEIIKNQRLESELYFTLKKNA